MNYNKLTEKSVNAVQSAQNCAREYGNPELTEIHLLYALLTQENALLPQILRSMNVDNSSFENSVLTALQSLPKQSGGQLYMQSELSAALDEAEKKAQQMNDEYVSVEHLFMGMLKHPDDKLKQLFRTYDITENEFLSALKNIRGNSRGRISIRRLKNTVRTL